MKLLHVIPSVGPLHGGPGFVLRAVARGLAARGCDVHVATTNDNGTGQLEVPLGVPVVEQGVTYWYFDRQTSFYTASLPLGAWLWKRMGDYALVHVHALFSFSSTVAAWLAARKRIPYIVRPLGVLNQWGIRNRRPMLKKISLRICESRLLEKAFAVQYTTEQEKQEAELLGYRSRGVIIPNPVQLESRPKERAMESFRCKYPELQGKTIFLFLSRLHEKKGLDLLLPALKRVREQHPQVALVIAGTGSARLIASLQSLARELGLTDCIVWTGFLQGEEKLEALAAADVFVLPSYSENFGVAAVEAMAAGVPLAITDHVGISREVATHRAGLIASCDVESVASVMAELANNPTARREMGRQGAVLARSAYSVEAVCTHLMHLYSQSRAA